jgi:CPA1 family monovalent cation:H+ antiporter
VWEITVFVLNALLFTLVGLQLRPIVDGITGHSFGELLAYGAIVSGTVIGVRIVWLFTAPYIQWKLIPLIRDPQRLPSARARAVTAWSGMRGAVTLAAALALPLRTDAGASFPERNLVIYLAFTVILVTLVGQGLTLPVVARAARLPADDSEDEEESLAWVAAAEAALGRLEELVEEDWVRPDTAQRLVDSYQFRRRRFAARTDANDDGAIEQRSADFRRLRRTLLDTERDALLELRRAGRIGDTVMQRVQHELDLEDERMSD